MERGEKKRIESQGRVNEKQERKRYICKVKKTERDGKKNRIWAKCGTGGCKTTKGGKESS